MNRLWPLLLPEIRQFPDAERDGALRSARGTALDVVELAGMAAALACVTGLTGYALPETSISTHMVAALLNVVIALPLLALALGPFHLRRLRRGLREQIERRGRR